LEVRRIPVDGAYRMRPDLLDLDGACAVVATAGTTSTTSSDPIADIADRAGDVWLHVDAAYAGSAWVCPELRVSATGIERVDSLVVNPHKWMLTGMGCSCLWTARVADFRRAFSLVPEYLRVAEDVVSLSEVSIPLGRPFRALRLWAVLRCFGRSGLQAMIREHVRLAELFEGWVRDEPGWELCAPRPFSVVCFRRDGSDEDNERLLGAVNASGEIFISQTKLAGRYVLRLAIGNARTTEDDVRRAWDVLRREAAAL
jgi:aromatic-L-amino-acid decarboxylase